MENCTIQTEDGRLLVGNWIRASGALPVRGTIVFHSATGVPCTFYNAFATYLSEHALDVFLWDARGIGKSANVHARDDSATMRDWGQRDQQAVLNHLRSADPSRKLVIVGHSSGGHLSGLAPLTSKADALILIASGGCDWRDYPPSQWPRLLAAWWLAMPLLLKFWGYLPAWAGVGHDLPRGVAQDWRRWSLTQGYLFGDATLDTTGYSGYCGPLLALSISDDQGFAPPGTVRALLQRFLNAKTQHHEIPAAEGHRGRIGHFGFFKSQNAALWPYVMQWLDIVLGASEASGQSREDSVKVTL
jgi:predicted alpha/beta hydrolase